MKTLYRYLYSIIVWFICFGIAHLVVDRTLTPEEVTIIITTGIINLIYGVTQGMKHEK